MEQKGPRGRHTKQVLQKVVAERPPKTAVAAVDGVAHCEPSSQRTSAKEIASGPPSTTKADLEVEALLCSERTKRRLEAEKLTKVEVTRVESLGCTHPCPKSLLVRCFAKIE